MARKGLLYFLFSKEKKPLYVDDNGFVQEGNENYFKLDGQPAHLKNSPDGWGDTLVKYARNIKYWGLFRDMTVPMRFVKDGFEILKNRVWNFSVEVILYLGIMKLDKTSVPYNYYPWYLSELNFVKYKEENESGHIEALEGGLSKLFKAYENTPYEIPIEEDPEHFYVKQDGVSLTEKSIFNMIDGFEIKKSFYGTEIFLPILQSAREGHSTGVVFLSQDIQSVSGLTFDQKINAVNKMAIANTDAGAPIDVHIYGEIIFTCTVNDPGLGFIMRFLKSTMTVPTQNDFRFFNTTPLVVDNVYTVPVDYVIPLVPGEVLHLEGIFGTGGDDIGIIFDPASKLTAEFVGRAPATYVPCLWPETVIRRLIEKMSDGLYTASSAYLLNRKDIALTSGNAIRGLTENKIITSVSDFFKSLNIPGPIMLGIKNDVLNIEQWSDGFKANTIVNLGEIGARPHLTYAEDLAFNTIKVGGPAVEYDDVNGKYEPNQGQVWKMPITKIVKELDLISVYRYDSIGMELLRINYQELTTTDKTEDKLVFMMNIETELQPEDVENEIPAHYNLNRPAFTDITGIPASMKESIFNIIWTPKRVLQLHGPYIHSIGDGLDAEFLTLQTGDKNTDFATEAPTVVEKDPIQIGNLPAKIFKPWYINMVTKVPINVLGIFNADPYGRIQFTKNGKTFYSFVFDGGINPATNDKQNWKTLSAPENDLSKFNGKSL